MGHISPGSSGQSGSNKARFTSVFGSSVSTGSFHSFTCHDPKSWRKMHWCESSPPYGCLQLLCHSNQPCLMSCLKYDERKQKQRHLSQTLKSSTFGTECYNLCISRNKYYLFTEVWINVLTDFKLKYFEEVTFLYHAESQLLATYRKDSIFFLAGWIQVLFGC